MAFRILYNAASDGTAVVISSSSEAGSHIDNNAVKEKVNKIWETDGTSTEWIKFNLVVTSKKVDCITIINHNLDAGDTITFEGNATDSWGSPTVNETLTIATDSDGNVLDRITHYFTQATLQWWRVTIDDADSSKSEFQIGRIMFGEYYDTTRDITADLRIETMDPSEGTKTPGTIQDITQKARYRRIRTSFAFVTQVETDKWTAIFDYLGNSKPALICWDTTRATKDSAYVYMLTPLNLAHQFSGQYNIAAIVWEEKTR
jgi:hypothetical protein